MLNKPRKIYVAVDMEGISGIVDPAQVGGDPQEYAEGRSLMASDLNAVIDAALETGVEDIVVYDIHGNMRNLRPFDVHDCAYLIRGASKPELIMPTLANDFDAVLYVGFHSKNGTENGLLCHPFGGVMEAIFVNDQEVGELGICVGIAGSFEIPSIFVSGDAALASEAKGLIPNIRTAIVKWSLGWRVAKCLHPNRARAIIKKTAVEALKNVDKIEPYRVKEPVDVKIRFTTSEMADALTTLSYVEKVDIKTVKMTFSKYNEVVQGLRASITLAGASRRHVTR
jgi:D-amino peptidase